MNSKQNHDEVYLAGKRTYDRFLDKSTSGNVQLNSTTTFDDYEDFSINASGIEKHDLAKQSPHTRTNQKTPDRFIPNRANSLLEHGLFSSQSMSISSEYALRSREILLGPEVKNLFSYSPKKDLRNKMKSISPLDALREACLQNYHGAFRQKYKIKNNKTLDAPGLYSDYYAHLLSCSKSNKFFIPLMDGHQCILHCASLLYSSNNEVISSRPMPQSIYPSSINSLNGVDVVSGWKDGSLRKHTLTSTELVEASVIQLSSTPMMLNCLAPIDTHHLWVGSTEGLIFQVDTRVANSVGQFAAYSNPSERLKLSGVGYNQVHHIAFGTNEGYVKVWDIRMVGQSQNRPFFADYVHNGTGIKSVKFNPNAPEELMTGGGKDCKHIVFRNIQNNQQLATYQMTCQVTGISWLTKPNMFMVSCGFSKTLSFFKRKKNNLLECMDNHVINLDVKRTIYMDSFDENVAVACEGFADDGIVCLFSVDGYGNKDKSVLDMHYGHPDFLKTLGSFTIR